MSALHRPARLVVVLSSLAIALLGASAAADDAAGATREPAKHFQRAVALYGEADYRAALVEFKRAYALAPNPAVLYNVGETEYQLQDYAAALTTFERFLAEANPGDPHRAEVEGNVDILRARVGHLSISTAPPGADVTVDDQSAGRTPLEKSVLVSIGRRKVVASMAGRAPVTRYVDVAADDNVSVVLQLPGPAEPAPATALAPAPQPAHAEPASSGAGGTLRTLGWISAGASGAGAVAFGLLALKESSDLKAARASYPVSSSTLSHDASLTTTYSAVADSLAAAAILIGGVTLVSTLTGSGSTKRGSADPQIHVSLGLASARFEMKF